MKRRQWIKLLVLIVAALVIFVLERAGLLPAGSPPAPSGPAVRAVETGGADAGPAVDAEGVDRIVSAFEAGASGIVVEAGGVVDRLLPDDDDGSRHQRFVVRLAGGHTVLIAHNLDLADRAPVETGDVIAFRGQYEWNERGGVIHWTHHDPQRRRPGGWIDHEGRRYR